MRIVAAFFVVSIHAPFMGTIGAVIVSVARFAVPFFFAVSGFFCFYADKTQIPKKVNRKIRHILFLFLGSSVLYFIYNALPYVIDGNFLEYVKPFFSLKSIAEFLFFNNTHISEFMWYFPALIYCFLFFLILNKIERNGVGKRTSLALFIVLSVLGVTLKEIILIFPNSPEFLKNGFICRNFLFIGVPFFMMGYYIRLNKEELTRKLNYHVLVAMMVSGVAEVVLVHIFHTTKSLYLGTIISVFALFVFLIKSEDKIKIPHIASVGRKYSLYVYIFHIIIRDASKILESRISFYAKIMEVLSPFRTFIIFFYALIFSIIYVKIKSSIKKLKRE